ncbi:MAG: S9 family peptidase [Roseibium sp.]|uniref:S9 family peptidase n=1 Tax=Roseibium sp. TaxID=1936156 RepID=UPI00262DBEC3|nr:S9 family peptidase [Roseibium sp.]MCV0424446.1 S9 family peptidase [Roseibium sp.]
MFRLLKTLFWFVISCTAIYIGSFQQTVSAQDRWTPELSLNVNRLSELAFSPDGKELIYGVNSVDIQNDRYLVEYVISDTNGADVRTLIEKSSHSSSPQWSPDGHLVAYLSSKTGVSNIWFISSQGGESRQITDVSRDISSFKWSPDGNSIAFVMADPDFVEPDVEDADIFNKNRLWHLKLDKDKKSGKLSDLTENAEFSVSEWAGNWAYDWSPDSREVVFAHQERPGLDYWAKAQISIVEVATKDVKRLDAGNENWMYFPKFSPDGKWIAFINAPGAFKWSFLWDMKLFSVHGGDIVDLPPSKNRLPFPWEWADDSQSLYFIENDRVTYSFYEMPIDGSPYAKVFGAPDNLRAPGLNTYLTSSYIDVSGKEAKLAFIGQTHNQPPEIYVSDLTRFAPMKISQVNDRFNEIGMLRTELVEWRSLDNTPVEGLLSYPENYKEGERFPLVVQIHGGPNGADFNEYLPLMKFFATAVYLEKGYFVLRVNYRGTLGYGRKFREGLVGNFGSPDYQDIMSGVNHVIDLGLVDPEQLFVIGQSNGGTLTSWIITQTDRFRSACPVAGETDYISLEGTNGYFQTSWYLGGSFIDNLQMFLDRSPIFHVKNVRTPVLIQGGIEDDNVPYTQLEEFYRALKRVGVDAHLVGYPGSTHDHYPPKLYLRLLQSCLEWTEKHRRTVQ